MKKGLVAVHLVDDWKCKKNNSRILELAKDYSPYIYQMDSSTKEPDYGIGARIVIPSLQLINLSFQLSELERVLKADQIEEVHVVGYFRDLCVARTVHVLTSNFYAKMLDDYCPL